MDDFKYRLAAGYMRLIRPYTNLNFKIACFYLKEKSRRQRNGNA